MENLSNVVVCQFYEESGEVRVRLMRRGVVTRMVPNTLYIWFKVGMVRALFGSICTCIVG